MGTTTTRGRRIAGAGAGLLAAGTALGVATLTTAFVGADTSPVVAVGGAVIDATPVWLKDFAIRTFGTHDKLALLSGIVVLLAGFAVGVGILAVRRLWLGIVGVVVFGLVGTLTALSRPAARPLDIVPSVLGTVAGVAALVVLARRLQGTGPAPVRAAAGPDVGPVGIGGRPDRFDGWRDRVTAGDRKGVGYDRRGFLRTGLAVAGIAAAAGTGGRRLIAARFDASASRRQVAVPKPASPAPATPAGVDLELPQLSRFYTRNADFYRVDINLLVPTIAAEKWRLRLHGMVRREIELDFGQLLDRPLIERDITLTCVSNEVGGPYVGTARWVGAPLGDLLREAGVDPRADQLVSRSVDGFTVGTPTAAVLDGRDAMLAVSMNGEPLPIEHGFPVRMVVPGLYGYVSATKWVVDLQLTTFAGHDTYWTRRGWARTAPIKTMSRIDTPRPLARVPAGRTAVAGVAWAQHRGIAAVEVRVDGGVWSPARLAAEDGIDTWRQWVWAWDATPGQHTLEVRATDKTRQTQTDKRRPPDPDGASGWHSVVVAVT